MATVNYIPYKKQNKGALGGVAQYVSQSMKTLTEDGRRLVSGQNCSPQLAFREFVATREMHHKKSPVWFYHYTQSFHPDENITGEEAHAVAKEFAARAWPESEVLIATHVDAAHIHSHFLVNAVCFNSGKMLRQGPDTLRKLRQISDEICLEHQLSVLPPKGQKKDNGLSAREYRSAERGESWKFRLMNMIDECMRYASYREEFVRLMRSEGYDLRWSDSRRNITYITPEGMKCRDSRLHEEKYLKEVMKREFRIRTEALYGRAASEEQTAEAGAGDQHPVPKRRAGRHVDCQPGDDHIPAEKDQSEAGLPCNAGGADTDAGNADGDPGYDATGWEEERESFFATQTQTAQTAAATLGWSNLGSPTDGAGSIVSALVGLGRRLEQSRSAVPVIDSTTVHHHADRKMLRREKEKKIALGQKEDDHEEEQTWQQTM